MCANRGRRAPLSHRIYVSNIPYEYKWQDLKDLFRNESEFSPVTTAVTQVIDVFMISRVVMFFVVRFRWTVTGVYLYIGFMKQHVPLYLGLELYLKNYYNMSYRYSRCNFFLLFFSRDSIVISVGEVNYVELFKDDTGRPRGCGIIEFETAELAQKAIDNMHRYELAGRKLVVKEV